MTGTPMWGTGSVLTEPREALLASASLCAWQTTEHLEEPGAQDRWAR